jgi:hypothetical protein
MRAFSFGTLSPAAVRLLPVGTSPADTRTTAVQYCLKKNATRSADVVYFVFLQINFYPNEIYARANK